MEKQSALGSARTPRQRFWLEHLKACREQGLSLKAYARTHKLSVSALYTANSALKRRALSTEGTAPAPKLVPVRLASGPSMIRQATEGQYKAISQGRRRVGGTRPTAAFRRELSSPASAGYERLPSSKCRPFHSAIFPYKAL